MTKEIPLTQGFVALVDDDDYPLVMAAGRWHAKRDKRSTYALHSIRSTTTTTGWTSEAMHRFLVDWPLIDHINGDGLDNRRSNLRPASSTQNAANRQHFNPNVSGFRGVSYNRGRLKPWKATVGQLNRVHCGYFYNPEEAARAYDAAAFAQWGEFAILNFPVADLGATA